MAYSDNAAYTRASCFSVGSAQQYQGSLIAGTGRLSARAGGSAGAVRPQAACASSQTRWNMARRPTPSRSPCCTALRTFACR